MATVDVVGARMQLEDSNMRVCSMLGTTTTQALHADHLWREWHQHRVAQDERLAAAVGALLALPTSAAIPTWFLLHLSAVAGGHVSVSAEAGSSKKRGRRAGAAAAAPAAALVGAAGLGDDLVGVSAAAAERAAAAVRGLQQVSAEEKGGFAEFLARMWMPSPAVGVLQMVAVWAAAIRCCALCDMLRVLQMVVQQRQRQAVEGSMAQLRMGGGAAEYDRGEGALVAHDAVMPNRHMFPF